MMKTQGRSEMRKKKRIRRQKIKFALFIFSIYVVVSSIIKLGMTVPVGWRMLDKGLNYRYNFNMGVDYSDAYTEYVAECNSALNSKFQIISEFAEKSANEKLVTIAWWLTLLVIFGLITHKMYLSYDRVYKRRKAIAEENAIERVTQKLYNERRH